jgi:hypothetical protein
LAAFVPAAAFEGVGGVVVVLVASEVSAAWSPLLTEFFEVFVCINIANMSIPGLGFNLRWHLWCSTFSSTLA